MPALSDAEIQRRLPQTSGWRLQGGVIQATFKFADFKQAMTFVNRVADAAEEAQHHPDIDIRYNTVQLGLSTHDEGGITDKDFGLATRINQISQM
ncbi:MAG: 4a-hydroxytetrahydrobiopterin dehydratase [Chloroflexi bacterium]|nr:4a-hydroxytetrahydrobiopterin dehydratase [Chloroflexota bacterium]